ncbi:MAG: HTTM domain-containing protein [Oligoflexales bacterium]
MHSGRITRTLQRWSDQWFRDVPTARLAVVRVLLGAYALHYLYERSGLFESLTRYRNFLFQPVGLAHFLTGPLSANGLLAVYWSSVALGVCFIAGLAFRLTGPLFAVGSLFLLSYRNSWQMIFHTENLLALHVLILSISQAGDALSIDALLGHRLAKNSSRQTLAAKFFQKNGTCSSWPLNLIIIVTSLAYFVAGVAKLAGPAGVAWIQGQVVLNHVIVDALRKDILGWQPSEVVAYVLDWKAAFWFFAIGTIILELGAPLFMLGRRLRYFWVVNVIAMHWGIFAIMGITFYFQMYGVAYLAFFPLEKLAAAPLRMFKRFRHQEDSSVDNEEVAAA